MRFTFLVTLVALGLLPVINCQLVELTGTYGTIKVGDFRDPYGANIDKTWRITVRPGYRVHIYFTTFDIEDSYEDDVGVCAYDYVQVEGHRRLCGNRKDFPLDSPKYREVFKSENNVMNLHFVSDYSNDDPQPIGFEAHWMEEDIDECYELRRASNSGIEDWDQILYCNHFCHNIGASYYCSCRPGYTLDANEHTCVADCKAEVEASENGGFVQSPEYPLAYGKLSDCETSLEAGVGKRMDIRFDDVFGIEDHYEEEGCVYDYLEITDQRGNTTRYCGESAPANGSWIALDSNPIRILFHSDLVIEKAGYKMNYRIYPVRCQEVLQAPAYGSISIPDKVVLEYEDKISFACNRGFRLIGSNVSECMANGEWSTPTPTCQIKNCPRPDALLNIPRTNPPEFEEEERPFNSTITIPCVNQWYELVSGASEWFCDDDETWHESNFDGVPYNNNNNYTECRPVCGIKNTLPQFDTFIADPFDSLILNGRNARYGEWPWMAFIAHRRTGLREDHFCGGSLVDEQYVVTAAHCIGRKMRPLTVYLGVTDRHNESHVQTFSVIRAVEHSGFADFDNNPYNLFDNDIAVLKLDRPAQIGRYVRPICLPLTPLERDLPATDTRQGVVAGWGITELNRTARILKLVRVPYVNTTYCMQVYQQQSLGLEHFDRVMVTNNQFCAGFLDLAKDSCDGDSGGPLMWKNGRRWLLNGIVSFGTTLGSCQHFVIGVYTKVANYMEFLGNHIILEP